MPDVILRAGLSLLVIGLLGAAAVLGGLVQVAPLPKPSGAYPVGTTVRMVEAPGKVIGVQLWYPARNVEGVRRARYRFADSAGVPLRSRLLSSLVKPDSYIDADVALGTFPIILYVPAWGGTRGDNTALAQSLASQGFVVVAMDDLFPTPTMDLSSAKAYQDSVRWANEKVRRQASAAQNVLDALNTWNSADPGGRLTSHLRIARVGALGFSFGGAVAAELAAIDARVVAASDMDGWLFGEAADHGVSKPFLTFSSTGPPYATGESAPPDERYAAILDREDDAKIRAGLEKYGGVTVTIQGTEHLNFSDVPFFPSIRHTGVGSIDARHCAQIIDSYLTRFFDHWLNAGPAPVFESHRQHDPAVRVEVWHAPGSK